MGLLNEKTALITGGSRGIGKALVERFLSEGARVAFTYQSSATASEAIMAELNSGENLKAYKSDASSYEQSEELVKQVLNDFGKIDILINNAGITKDTLILRMTEEQWDDVIQVNLKSVFNLTKHVVRPMLKNRSGSIINMSSVVGVFGNAGQSNYSASKAGIIGFTKSMAKELGSRGIRCNAIAPGFIESEMTAELEDSVKDSYVNSIPLKRFGQGNDVANACTFLGSDMSTYITGQVLSVCGGMNI